MKTIFFLLACTCLINGLNAFYLGNLLEEEKTNFDDLKSSFDLEVVPEESQPEELILPYPSIKPRPPVTTSPPTVPTTTTIRTTTTQRTTTSNPSLKNVQIYNNAYRSMGPLAGRLINVVMNKGKAQKTVQTNEILYNLNYSKKTRDLLKEGSEH